MRAYSKFLVLFLSLVLVLISFSLLVNAETTSDETPKEVSLKWASQIGSGWTKSAGAPIMVDDNIVIMAGDEISIVNSENGEIIKTVKMAEAQSYGYVAPTFADDAIFANLSNGTVQAFDSKALTPIWTYVDSLGGKGMTPVTYSDKMVFTGFWTKETGNASFVALDSKTGELKWSKTIDGGLYWAGAYCTDNAVIFATDDGNDKIAHIYSCNKTTGEVISSVDIENKGDIRSSVAYDDGRIYVTTKGGYLISAALTNDVLSDVKYGEIGAASTSTPVIYDERIYIGASDKTISVFDKNTLAELFSVSVKGYPQCTPLISTAYVNSEGYLYLYTTYNTIPGGVTLVKISPDATSSEDCIVTELFDAEGYSQYCISDIISDSNGTLYYKNDSGYLFALTDNSVAVNASLTEDGFIVPKRKVRVVPTLAESYGYTDTVTGAVSALDVLVKIHENIFGADFTPDTASEYLGVSREGYLSRIIGMDTYNFGFAINGSAPHDDILTDYGYTGYSLNQAAVKDDDKVEFFLYRDSWAMDNYVRFEKNGTFIDSLFAESGEDITLTIKGYPIGWYGCYEDSQIQNMLMPISNAHILLVESESGITDVIAQADENGNITLSFEKVGKYVISASGHEEDYPMIAPWLEVNILGIDVEIDMDSNMVTIVSNLEDETDCYIIIAEYNENILMNAIVLDTTLKNDLQTLTIDTSELSGEVKAFVWSDDMIPFTEVK